MTGRAQYPDIDPAVIKDSRDSLHACAGILGDCLKACRTRRKHWWHASLRPSLNGLTTGVVAADADFELELDLRNGLLAARSANAGGFDASLGDTSIATLAGSLGNFLARCGVGDRIVDGIVEPRSGMLETLPYDDRSGALIGQALTAVATSLADFRAGLREETSPIQVWPHHFDLSMLWLPGLLIAGADPADEEQADKQLNFGFTFGDDQIPEPYFYVTAYPATDALERALPALARWSTEGFTGAVLPYAGLVATDDPDGYLRDFWTGMLTAGREALTGACA